MQKRCGCSCMGHSCYCLEGKCNSCGCGPGRYLFTEARSDYCVTHSLNHPHGQNCPSCVGGK